MPYPHTLTGLTTREAITDALYRAVLAFDRNDTSLLDSAFAGEDSVFEMHSGPKKTVIPSLSTVRDTVFANVGPMHTTHMLSNIRIDVKDGADTASMTAYVLAQHCPPGRVKEVDAPKYLIAGEYQMELVRDDRDRLWKIRKWILHVIWKQGDSSVMGRE